MAEVIVRPCLSGRRVTVWCHYQTGSTPVPGTVLKAWGLAGLVKYKANTAAPKAAAARLPGSSPGARTTPHGELEDDPCGDTLPRALVMVMGIKAWAHVGHLKGRAA